MSDTWDEATEVLERAVDALNSCGWIQGRSGGPSDGFCSLGALDYAFRRGRFSTNAIGPAWRRLVKAVNAAAGLNTTVPKWNDDPSRTKEEVLAVYQVAISQEEE